MAAAKKYMTSYYVLYACFAIIIVVFAAFFGYGYNNEENGLNAPYCTEGLMWLKGYCILFLFHVCFIVDWSFMQSE